MMFEANRKQLQPGRLSEEGRLGARPRSIGAHDPSARTGLLPLELGSPRDGLLYVPERYSPSTPAPLIVMLHGAGGNAQHGLAPLLNLADQHGLVLLSPDSRGPTWDVILGAYGPDVDFIDEAMEYVYERYSIDPDCTSIGGFSDGASYALSLGLANGDHFGAILAFSPGFMAPPLREGQPRIYVSHGTTDSVLPIEACSRRLVPALRRQGYDVNYHEFDGGHTVPLEVARDAVDWLRF